MVGAQPPQPSSLLGAGGPHGAGGVQGMRPEDILGALPGHLVDPTAQHVSQCALAAQQPHRLHLRMGRLKTVGAECPQEGAELGLNSKTRASLSHMGAGLDNC